jgi:AcrR family transcriptional regulator
MAKRAYPSARAKILEAAEAVIRRDGIKRLSVDTVVAEAGISKGGFFYHFKTKDELLAALLQSVTEEMTVEVTALVEADPEPRGRILRSIIRAAFDFDADPARRDRFVTLTLAVLTVSIESPTLLAEVRRGNDEQLTASASDGLSLAHALLLNAAVEGFWIGQSLGSTTVPEPLRRQLRDLLVALTRVDLDALTRSPAS